MEQPAAKRHPQFNRRRWSLFGRPWIDCDPNYTAIVFFCPRRRQTIVNKTSATPLQVSLPTLDSRATSTRAAHRQTWPLMPPRKLDSGEAATTIRVHLLTRLNRSINVNDPGLITLVNKLQDVFTTVGVRFRPASCSDSMLTLRLAGPKPHRPSSNRCRRLAIEWKEFGLGKHSWQRLPASRNWYRDQTAAHPATHQQSTSTQVAREWRSRRGY